MVLRERASLIVELSLAIVAVTATLAFVARQSSVPARYGEQNRRGVCLDLPAVPSFDRRTIHVEVPPDMPPIELSVITTTDVGTDEAELRMQLADAARIGMAASSSIEQRFEALVVARRLDLVLATGNAHELATALASVTPKAATAYVSRNDYAHAQIAVTTAESLGLGDDANIRAVRRHLNSKPAFDF